jgi:hypothetical protein
MKNKALTMRTTLQVPENWAKRRLVYWQAASRI